MGSVARMTIPHPRHSAWPLLLFTIPWTLGSCKGCGEDRPYTPFGVASSLPPQTLTPPVAAVSMDPRDAGIARFAPQKATRAPSQARQWRLGSHSLAAPEGMVFHSGLAADLDGDNSEDAVAWVESGSRDPANGGGYRAALWYYPGGAPPRQLSELPGFVPSGPGCTVTVGLARTGPKTVTVEALGTCSTPRLPRSPARSLQVIAPGRPEPQLMGLRVAEPAPDEDLSLSSVTTDRDADGLDDVDLTVTVSRVGSERPASAHWVWLDRPAGTSRDESEPGASFASLASVEQVRSSGKKTSKTTLEAVDNARRLQATMCAESGTERLWSWDGSSLRCGSLGTGVDRLSHAELQASLIQRNVLRAFSVLERDGWYGRKISTNERAKLERLLKSSLKTRSARATALSVRARRGPESPHYSALAFEPGGALLVQTESGVVRATGTQLGASEPGADGGVPLPAPWPIEPVSPRGERWVGAIHACGRSEVSFIFSGSPGSAGTQLPTNVPAARPGPCTGHAFQDRRPPVPVAWTVHGLTALVGGTVVELGPLSAARSQVPAGSPLSADGNWIVVPTELGVLLQGNAEAELWELDSAVSPDVLHHCVVAPGAARVACLDGATVWLIDPAQ